MKCSHKKAKTYLEAVYIDNQTGFNENNHYKVKCNRCKKWIGGEPKGYPLPKDFKSTNQIKIYYEPIKELELKSIIINK